MIEIIRKLTVKSTVLAVISSVSGCGFPAIAVSDCYWVSPIYLSESGVKALEKNGTDADIAALAGHNMKYEKNCGLD